MSGSGVIGVHGGGYDRFGATPVPGSGSLAGVPGREYAVVVEGIMYGVVRGSPRWGIVHELIVAARNEGEVAQAIMANWDTMDSGYGGWP